MTRIPVAVPITHIVYASPPSSTARDVLVAAIPAAVALAVVFIGGGQSRRRMEAQLADGRTQWQEQQDFERQKFRMQERRTIYADFLAALDRLGYLSMHATSHEHDDATKEDAYQLWMERHDKLMNTIMEIRIIGSDEFVAIADEVDAFWATWLTPILAESAVTEQWHRPEAGPRESVYSFIDRATAQARAEVGSD